MDKNQISISLEILSFLFITTDIYHYLSEYGKIVRNSINFIIVVFIISLIIFCLSYAFGWLIHLNEPTWLSDLVFNIGKHFLKFWVFVIVVFSIELILLSISKRIKEKTGYFVALGTLLFLLSKFILL